MARITMSLTVTFASPPALMRSHIASMSLTSAFAWQVVEALIVKGGGGCQNPPPALLNRTGDRGGRVGENAPA